MKATLFFSLLPLLATAATPACLLSAVNTADDPSDLDTICASKEAPSIQQAIFKLCASGTLESSSGTFVYTTAVYNSDCSCTSTIVTSATGASAASTGSLTASSATATATGSDSTAASSGVVATGAANANANMLKEMSGLAAAMVAAVGVLAAL
ncbi:hypothetical protein DV737_g5499, partial [Chaetothyriales sp. CBS 132003]